MIRRSGGSDPQISQMTQMGIAVHRVLCGLLFEQFKENRENFRTEAREGHKEFPVLGMNKSAKSVDQIFADLRFFADLDAASPSVDAGAPFFVCLPVFCGINLTAGAGFDDFDRILSCFE